MPEALSAIATVVEVVVPFGDGLSALSPPDSGIVVGTGAETTSTSVDVPGRMC